MSSDFSPLFCPFCVLHLLVVVARVPEAPWRTKGAVNFNWGFLSPEAGADPFGASTSEYNYFGPVWNSSFSPGDYFSARFSGFGEMSYKDVRRVNDLLGALMYLAGGDGRRRQSRRAYLGRETSCRASTDGTLHIQTIIEPFRMAA